MRLIPPARASLAFVAFAWVLPFLQTRHRLPIPSFYSEWLAFALAIPALLFLLRRPCWEPVRLPRIALPVLAMVGLLFTQWVLGDIAYLQQALLAAMYLLFFLALVWLGQILREALGLAALARALAWALLVGSMASAAIALAQRYGAAALLGGWINAWQGGAVAGNIAQVNHFADYIALGLASALYLFHIGRLPRWALGLCALPLVFVLGLSGSRSAWLFLAAFVVLA
ncbi:MAG: pilin glycosylation ligase domain-containing protein, partial [Parvularculaceae bacterium]|nr:pilin glycosylation ligase domain-containing protein [Parvularculaceae bacterium]